MRPIEGLSKKLTLLRRLFCFLKSFCPKFLDTKFLHSSQVDAFFSMCDNKL